MQKKWTCKVKKCDASLQGMLVFSQPPEFFTSSTLTVKLAGLKKEKEIQIRHSYCPFCGKKQDEPK